MRRLGIYSLPKSVILHILVHLRNFHRRDPLPPLQYLSIHPNRTSYLYSTLLGIFYHQIDTSHLNINRLKKLALHLLKDNRAAQAVKCLNINVTDEQRRDHHNVNIISAVHGSVQLLTLRGTLAGGMTEHFYYTAVASCYRVERLLIEGWTYNSLSYLIDPLNYIRHLSLRATLRRDKIFHQPIDPVIIGALYSFHWSFLGDQKDQPGDEELPEDLLAALPESLQTLAINVRYKEETEHISATLMMHAHYLKRIAIYSFASEVFTPQMLALFPQLSFFEADLTDPATILAIPESVNTVKLRHPQRSFKLNPTVLSPVTVMALLKSRENPYGFAVYFQQYSDDGYCEPWPEQTMNQIIDLADRLGAVIGDSNNFQEHTPRLRGVEEPAYEQVERQSFKMLLPASCLLDHATDSPHETDSAASSSTSSNESYATALTGHKEDKTVGYDTPPDTVKPANDGRARAEFEQYFNFSDHEGEQ